MAAAQTSATMASNRIDFIDEDDARGILFALFEQVANPAGAHAHEHFYEIRTRDREKRNVRLAGNRPGQQSLAGSRRSHQQYTLRDSSTQLLELLRLAQKFNNLAEFFLGLIHARHVFEGDLFLLHGEQPRTAFAK